MLEAFTFVSPEYAKVCKDSMTLDFDQRSRRRCLMKSDSGLEFLLNLPKATVLKQGDILRLTDDTLMFVKAAEEEVLDLYGKGSSLLSLAWYLGNMHRPVEIFPSYLRVRYEPLLEKSLIGLKVEFVRHKAPFSPQTSAGHNHE